MSKLEHAETKRQITNMPTWAPGWSYRSRYPLDSRHYRAAGDTTPNTSVSPCSKKIITRAFLFDKITAVILEISYPFKVDNGSFQNVSLQGTVILLKETCHQFCKRVQTRYVAIAIQGRIMMTLSTKSSPVL